MSQDLTDGKLTLIQVIAWCNEATRLYLGQCWQRSMLQNGINLDWQWVNSLAPGRCQIDFENIISKVIIPCTRNNTWGSHCEIAFRPMSQNLTDDKSKSVQVMAWWHLATSHWMSQCWPICPSPYGFTRPQWINNPKCDAEGGICHEN